MDLFAKCNTEGGYFGQFRARGDHFFTRPILEPYPGNRMIFQGKEVIQWSINNYLGLAGNEEIKALAVKAVEKYGTSSPMGSRMMTGNTEKHLELEKALADYCEKDAAVVFNYGYLGVLGTIASLVDKDDTIVIDELSHASMIDGTHLARGKYRVFKHNDMDDLEGILKGLDRKRKGGILIVTEGVFGMQGDLAYLPGICELKEKYEARVYVDDAHGFGVMGERGQGTGSYFGLQDKLDIYFGTFAKAFAAIGGFSAAEKGVCEWILFNARTQIFAKSLPMVYVEVLLRTLEIIKNDKTRRKRMWEVSRKLKEGLRNLGYNVGDVPSPITPVYVPVGDITLGGMIVIKLRQMGVFVTGVIYPVVPKGIVLFRMIPTAAHTDEDVEETIEAFRKVRDELNLSLNSPADK
ncbi:MAG: aminotransferase class I/II-fold pyridoxal phosphate-dependent enzyme [Candidatus Aminicenantales bacterium]